MRYTFVCVACEVVLDDGVDYSWCPACGGEVKRTAGPARPEAPARGPTLRGMTRASLVVVVVVQAILALVMPDAFPYLKTWLVLAQIAAVVVVLLTFALARDIRALARDKCTRILHGLEHATINLLLERGFPVRSGCTYDGEFVIRIDHDGRSWDRFIEIRDTARDAIIRIVSGEHALAYSAHCGTSWLVGFCLLALAIVASGATALALSVPTGIAFAGTAAAILIARAAKRPLGLWVQHWLTVSTDLLVASVKDMDRAVTPDGNTMLVTIAMDVKPRATKGGTVIPFVG